MIEVAAIQLLRLQYGITTAYYLLFVPLTIGLSLLLLIVESVSLLAGRHLWRYRTRRWEVLIGVNLVLLLGTGLYLLSTLGLGLVIGALPPGQRETLAADFFALNPSLALSGIGLPDISMPQSLHWLTSLDPIGYYLALLHLTFLKGPSLTAPLPDLLGMAALGSALLALSVFHFRKSLD